MKNKPLLFLFLFAFICFVFSCTAPDSLLPDSLPENLPIRPEQPPQRIVSTLPSITEVLFDIGLGNRIVGDSSYTKYPPEAQAIEKVGGLYDINREKLILLKPDLVIISAENTSLRRSISAPTLLVDHTTLSGIVDSYSVIGELFGEEVFAVAKNRQNELSAQLNAFEGKREGKEPIRTLIAIDRSRGTGRIQNLYVAGKNSFLNEVVEKAGGTNAAASIGLFAPTISAEGVLHLAPEVIIDLQVGGMDTGHSESDWYSLGDSVPAVKKKRILTLSDDFASVPGPRTPLLIEKIALYFDSIE